MPAPPPPRPGIYMPSQINDPLAVIASEVPSIPVDAAIALVTQHYGFTATARTLVSERDQNFLLETEDGRRFVLKIANAAEDPAFTEFQIRALEHIEARCSLLNLPIQTPRIVHTTDGRTNFEITAGKTRHRVRVVTWLDGTPVGRAPESAGLCRNLGAYLARLGIALAGFEHPGAEQRLLWDLKQAPALRDLFGYLPDERIRRVAERCLDDFERFALPRFGDLRSQVIHSDLNPDNVLIDPSDPEQPAGVIDFGDMTRSPLIADVGIAASYLREPEQAPLRRIAPFVGGYNAVTPLEAAEIELLPYLIQTRVLATVTISHWRAAARPADDPYLVSAASSQEETRVFLERLVDLPVEQASEELRCACDS